MAAENGIFVYHETAAGFDLVSPTPLLGSLTGKLTFGPDGRMYLMNSVTDTIERYTTDGTFVDAFISTPIFTPDVRNSSIQFGVDGNIHVFVGPTLINKFDGTTGALLGSTDLSSDNPDFQFGAAGRVTYLPVPEPTSLLLAAMVRCMVVTRRSRDRPQD